MFKLKHALALFIVTLGAFVFFNSSAHAASFTVAAGNDENTDNTSCALSEAIENINNQATTNTDCSPTGAYGTDDTINLPAGIITLTADPAYVTEDVSIVGQGMGVSIIDGASLYIGLGINTSDPGSTASVSGLTLTATKGAGLGLLSVKNVVVNQVEIDGTGSVPFVGVGGLLAGVYIDTGDDEVYDWDVSNVFVHDIEGDGGVYQNVMAVLFSVGDNAEINVNAQNIAIDDIHATGDGDNSTGISFTTGLRNYTAVSLDAVVENLTVNNLVSDDADTGGVVATNLAQDAGQASTMDIAVSNSTIIELSGSGSVVSGGIIVAGVEAGAEDDVTVNVVASNNLITNTTANCGVRDITYLFAGVGSPSLSLASNGGNLSDDTSCSSYFTQPTDQNNVTNLASTLGVLGDYGGYVPTIPLLEGSPAIDAGVAVAGLTSDARGVSRPLGLAYDSGAYESPFTKTVEGTETLASTGENTTLLGAIVALLLTLGLALYTRRHNA